MPSCSMASAAYGFGLTPNLTCSPSPSTSRSSNMLRLVVSYWHNDMGSVVAVDQDPKTRHPVVVRFNKVNYANVTTSNYALDKIQEL
ncbi:hypothetical protein LOK49_LG15G00733 [Camellia lanceoleosa]|uniref:Uncharacterized protein n=1 Tax=Camellia lanceoleosa TaxID=1840588 RepID=A0ACC0F614_9ERIC|nr:hypothetical protein LOK49_LG15G00733 [Camellia lanceoleosa]